MRASAAVSQQITGSFQISGIFRRDRERAARTAASARRPFGGMHSGSSAARALMPMKDGYAPIIAAGLTSRFLEK